MNKKQMKEKIKELERQIKIKDAWCQMIFDIGFDYDGYNDVKNLKDIIDELVTYANKARANDEKTIAGVGISKEGREINYNILGEKIEDSNKSKKKNQK